MDHIKRPKGVEYDCDEIVLLKKKRCASCSGWRPVYPSSVENSSLICSYWRYALQIMIKWDPHPPSELFHAFFKSANATGTFIKQRDKCALMNCNKEKQDNLVKAVE